MMSIVETSASKVIPPLERSWLLVTVTAEASELDMASGEPAAPTTVTSFSVTLNGQPPSPQPKRNSASWVPPACKSMVFPVNVQVPPLPVASKPTSAPPAMVKVLSSRSKAVLARLRPEKLTWAAVVTVFPLSVTGPRPVPKTPNVPTVFSSDSVMRLSVTRRSPGDSWHELKKNFRRLTLGFLAANGGELAQLNLVTNEQKCVLDALNPKHPKRNVSVELPRKVLRSL